MWKRRSRIQWGGWKRKRERGREGGWGLGKGEDLLLLNWEILSQGRNRIGIGQDRISWRYFMSLFEYKPDVLLAAIRGWRVGPIANSRLTEVASRPQLSSPLSLFSEMHLCGPTSTNLIRLQNRISGNVGLRYMGYQRLRFKQAVLIPSGLIRPTSFLLRYYFLWLKMGWCKPPEMVGSFLSLSIKWPSLTSG